MISHSIIPICFGLMALSGVAMGQKANGSFAEVTQPFVDRGEIAGAVMLVANKEGVIALESVGWADREKARPMKTDSLFWIASQTKAVISVAAMIAVDRGHLQLDDPVSKYLPEFEGLMMAAGASDGTPLLKSPRRPPSIRDCLSCTAGFSRRFKGEYLPLDQYPLSSLPPIYAEARLQSEPGTKYIYSGAGFNLVARMIEMVSEQSIQDYLQESLFGPLEMKDTTFWPSEDQVKRLAMPYWSKPEEERLTKTQIEYLQVPLSDRTKRHPLPLGGLFSTATDMVQFYRMLANQGTLNGKTILAENSVAEMGRPHASVDETIGRTYGIGLTMQGSVMGHAGAYGSESFHDRDSGKITIWMIQQKGYHGAGLHAKRAFHRRATAAYLEATTR